MHTTLLDGEIEIVARLADQGLTCPQICRTLNHSRGAVWNALKRLGYPRRNNVILSVELAPNVSAALTAAANPCRLRSCPLVLCARSFRPFPSRYTFHWKNPAI